MIIADLSYVLSISGEQRVRSSLKGIQNSTKQATTAARGLQSAFSSLAGILTTGLILRGIQGITEAVANAESGAARFAVVFSSNLAEATQAAAELSKEIGVSDAAATSLLGRIGDIVFGIGATRDEALRLSRDVTQIAVALANFNPEVSIEQAANAITKALLGEREAIKSLGIVLSDTGLREFAAAQGLVFDQLTTLEKAFLTYTEIVNQSGNALSFQEAGTTTLSTETAELKASVQDLVTELGEDFVPLLKDLVQILTSVTEVITPASVRFGALGLGLVVAGRQISRFVKYLTAGLAAAGVALNNYSQHLVVVANNWRRSADFIRYNREGVNIYKQAIDASRNSLSRFGKILDRVSKAFRTHGLGIGTLVYSTKVWISNLGTAAVKLAAFAAPLLVATAAAVGLGAAIKALSEYQIKDAVDNLNELLAETGKESKTSAEETEEAASDLQKTVNQLTATYNIFTKEKSGNRFIEQLGEISEQVGLTDRETVEWADSLGLLDRRSRTLINTLLTLDEAVNKTPDEEGRLGTTPITPEEQDRIDNAVESLVRLRTRYRDLIALADTRFEFGITDELEHTRELLGANEAKFGALVDVISQVNAGSLDLGADEFERVQIDLRNTAEEILKLQGILADPVEITPTDIGPIQDIVDAWLKAEGNIRASQALGFLSGEDAKNALRENLRTAIESIRDLPREYLEAGTQGAAALQVLIDKLKELGNVNVEADFSESFGDIVSTIGAGISDVGGTILQSFQHNLEGLREETEAEIERINELFAEGEKLRQQQLEERLTNQAFTEEEYYQILEEARQADLAAEKTKDEAILEAQKKLALEEYKIRKAQFGIDTAANLAQAAANLGEGIAKIFAQVGVGASVLAPGLSVFFSSASIGAILASIGTFPGPPKLASGGFVPKVPGGREYTLGEGRYREAVIPLPPGLEEALMGLGKGNSQSPGYTRLHLVLNILGRTFADVHNEVKDRGMLEVDV